MIVIKNSLNPEGHQIPISGSKVTAILLKGWILPTGGASVEEGLCLQPGQQACFFRISNDTKYCSFPVSNCQCVGNATALCAMALHLGG